jgi:quercetin dioxygenase-like cupin family protein
MVGDAMRFVAKLKQRYGKLLIIVAVCGLSIFAASVHADDRKKMVVTSFQDAKFVPIDPAQPDGPQIAVLWGDPAKGQSAMLLKFKKGGSPLHIHTSDYHLTLLQGTMKHWGKGEQEADAKPLGPGSYWFQPGNQAHGDSCLSDECVMFIKWEGKRDGRLAEEPKK